MESRASANHHEASIGRTDTSSGASRSAAATGNRAGVAASGADHPRSIFRGGQQRSAAVLAEGDSRRIRSRVRKQPRTARAGGRGHGPNSRGDHADIFQEPDRPCPREPSLVSGSAFCAARSTTTADPPEIERFFLHSRRSFSFSVAPCIDTDTPVTAEHGAASS